MKISSADPIPQPPRDQSKAWACLISNLLVLPGLGSLMARRRVGYVQILLALGGFGLTIVALTRVVLVWVEEFQLPDAPNLYGQVIFGLAIFLFAWIWSLITSLTLFRSRK